MVSCTACGQQNPGGFRFCGSCGSQLEWHAASREVRKMITVVFCDLAESTALGTLHFKEFCAVAEVLGFGKPRLFLS